MWPRGQSYKYQENTKSGDLKKKINKKCKHVGKKWLYIKWWLGNLREKKWILDSSKQREKWKHKHIKIKAAWSLQLNEHVLVYKVE